MQFIDNNCCPQNNPMKNATAHNIPLSKSLPVIVPFLWRNKSAKLKRSIIITLGLVLLTILLNLSVPLIFRDIVNRLAEAATTRHLETVMLLVAYGICWTASRFFAKFQEMAFYRPMCSAITDFSLEVFKHIHSLSLKFHLARETGKVASSIERSQRAISMIITNLLFRILPVFVETILAFFILWHFYGSEIGFLVVGVLVVYFCANYFLLGPFKIINANFETLDVMVDKYVIETLINSENIKVMAAEDFENRRADALLKNREESIKSLFWYGTLMTIVQAFLLGWGLIFISYIIGQRVLNGTLAIGDFVLVNGYLLLLFNPLEQIAGFIRSLIVDSGTLDHALKLLEQVEIIPESPNAADIHITQGTIQFEHVNFGYHDHQMLIHDFNLTIPAQSTVAIVGASGSGKSTLARLLFRFFDVSNGKILIDGQDIRNVTISSLHQQIAAVPQDIVLLNKSLKYNICYGNFDASPMDIDKVVRDVHLDKLMAKLPEGLETIVGERGVKLSGGEKQRIGIARALLKKPKIILFDEATSSLDTKTEKIVQNNIAEVTHNITTILIAHRLSTVIHADNIVVLDNGKLVEQGTHEQLLALKGYYAKLWEHQYAQK